MQSVGYLKEQLAMDRAARGGEITHTLVGTEGGMSQQIAGGGDALELESCLFDPVIALGEIKLEKPIRRHTK